MVRIYLCSSTRETIKIIAWPQPKRNPTPQKNLSSEGKRSIRKCCTTRIQERTRTREQERVGWVDEWKIELTKQGDFPDAVIDQTPNLGDDWVDGPRPLSPPRERHDAVAAHVVASAHYRTASAVVDDPHAPTNKRHTEKAREKNIWTRR
jgi:hypothetical protein